MEEQSSQALLKSLKEGDDEAAAEVFRRYVHRLVALARRRISDRLGRRLDADDVVQSVYRSFFHRAKQGHFEWNRNGDLWRLLAAITVRKTIGKAQFHSQQKRDVDREDAAAGQLMNGSSGEVAWEPQDEDAIALEDELRHIMEGLKEHPRKILQLRLQGESTEEIAQQIGRCERTVRRYLRDLRTFLEHRLDES